MALIMNYFVAECMVVNNSPLNLQPRVVTDNIIENSDVLSNNDVNVILLKHEYTMIYSGDCSNSLLTFTKRFLFIIKIPVVDQAKHQD